MTITVPQSKNYPSPLVSNPSFSERDPVEGNRMIPCEIDWGTMASTQGGVYFNLQNNATLTFSQIVALDIDNSQCGADVQFIFPDTSTTMTVPAYTPKLLVPVFTNQLQFYAVCSGFESEDITRFSLLNFVPPPIAVPTTQEQETAVFNNINVTVTGNTQIVPTTVNGTVEGLVVTFQGSATTGNTATVIWTVQDGQGNTIAGGQYACGAGSNPPVICFNADNLRVRFQTGIKLLYTTTGTPSAIAGVVSLYYRTP